jgi:hypothetical protein
MAGIVQRLINHPILRWSKGVQRMVNRWGQRCARKSGKERAKAYEGSETENSAENKHFGITSGSKHFHEKHCILLVGRNDEQTRPG